MATCKLAELPVIIRTVDDLRALDGHPEDRTLELKREPIDSDRLAEIVQAGANGIAPVFRIIIGADENAGQFDFSRIHPLRYPLRIGPKGWEVDTFDRYKTHVTQVISAQTDGYFEGLFEIHQVAVAGGWIIVFEVPQSNHRPHQNSKSKKYFIKADGRVRAMDDLEIDDAMQSRRDRRIAQHVATATEARIDQAAASVDTTDEPALPWTPDALSAIAVEPAAQQTQRYFSGDLMPGTVVSAVDERTGEDQEVRLVGEGSIWIKVCPQTVSRQWESADLRDLIATNLRDLTPLNAPSSCDVSFGRNVHGAAIWLVDPRDPATTRSAVQLYKDGAVWATDTLLLSLGQGPASPVKWILAAELEETLEEALPRYIGFATKRLGIALPLTALIGVSGIENFRLATSERGPYDRSARVLQTGVSDSFLVDANAAEIAATSPTRLLFPLYRKLWRAAGKTRPDDFRGKAM